MGSTSQVKLKDHRKIVYENDRENWLKKTDFYPNQKWNNSN